MKNLNRLKPVIFVFIGILLILSPIFVSQKAYSQYISGEDNFNPNYLISDEEMQNSTSMTREDVQAFLDDYKSTLANLRTEDENGVTRLAADIIYRAAQDYKINPKYLLVKLQKEQSLITSQSPTQKQLDGATGYGITDGCGWTCDSYFRNKGFGKQVAAAAGIIRWYYDNVNLEPWIKRAKQTNIIDGQVVIPENNATAFLYTYTPHLQGNKNFWLLWNKWFGQIFPDGTLAKGYEDSTVYLIQNGEKRAIKSMAVLMTRFDPKMIINIPDSELANYPLAKEITLPNYSILKQTNNYYLLDYDTLRPFENYEVVKKLGYNPDEIIDITADDIKDYTIGQIIKTNTNNITGRLARIIETNGLYYLKDNFYYGITDEQIAKINFPNLLEEKIKIIDLANYQPGENLKFNNGTLLGVKGDNKIYVIENGKKRHIASEEVYNAYGYSWKNIVWTDQITGINHPTGQPIYMPTRLASTIKDSTLNTATTNNLLLKTADAPIQTDNETKILTTPETDNQFVGQKFETSINTYLVADYDTQKILAGKNIDVIRPTASLTKVLTAYRLMVEGLKLDAVITYNSAEHQVLYHNFRTVEGEKFINKNLMQAMLVSSINTPAKMLVDSVEPIENNFIKRMNEQIKTWDLTKSKFNDVYGYDDGNVKTAREFLTIYTNSEKNKEVREILSTAKYEYDEFFDIDGKPHHYDYHSNELANKANLTFKIISSKTGYTDLAGSCLAMLIERSNDHKKFIIITMGNPDTENRFTEPEKLTEWALKNL